MLLSIKINKNDDDSPLRADGRSIFVDRLVKWETLVCSWQNVGHRADLSHVEQVKCNWTNYANASKITCTIYFKARQRFPCQAYSSTLAELKLVWVVSWESSSSKFPQSSPFPPLAYHANYRLPYTDSSINSLSFSLSFSHVPSWL